MHLENRRSAAGFTLIEVLVALAIVAVTLTAIGSLMARTARGTRSIDEHVALAETARAVEAGLPDRNNLKPGSLTGAMGSYRWRVDIMPFRASFLAVQPPNQWYPLAIVITVQSPAGPLLRINSIRLLRRRSG
jgi:general secretion pathway protein I